MSSLVSPAICLEGFSLVESGVFVSLDRSAVVPDEVRDAPPVEGAVRVWFDRGALGAVNVSEALRRNGAAMIDRMYEIPHAEQLSAVTLEAIDARGQLHGIYVDLPGRTDLLSAANQRVLPIDDNLKVVEPHLATGVRVVPEVHLVDREPELTGIHAQVNDKPFAGQVRVYDNGFQIGLPPASANHRHREVTVIPGLTGEATTVDGVVSLLAYLDAQPAGTRTSIEVTFADGTSTTYLAINDSDGFSVREQTDGGTRVATISWAFTRLRYAPAPLARTRTGAEETLPRLVSAPRPSAEPSAGLRRAVGEVGGRFGVPGRDLLDCVARVVWALRESGVPLRGDDSSGVRDVDVLARMLDGSFDRPSVGVLDQLRPGAMTAVWTRRPGVPSHVVVVEGTFVPGSVVVWDPHGVSGGDIDGFQVVDLKTGLLPDSLIGPARFITGGAGGLAQWDSVAGRVVYGPGADSGLSGSGSESMLEALLDPPSRTLPTGKPAPAEDLAEATEIYLREYGDKDRPRRGKNKDLAAEYGRPGIADIGQRWADNKKRNRYWYEAEIVVAARSETWVQDVWNSGHPQRERFSYLAANPGDKLDAGSAEPAALSGRPSAWDKKAIDAFEASYKQGLETGAIVAAKRDDVTGAIRKDAEVVNAEQGDISYIAAYWLRDWLAKGELPAHIGSVTRLRLVDDGWFTNAEFQQTYDRSSARYADQVRELAGKYPTPFLAVSRWDDRDKQANAARISHVLYTGVRLSDEEKMAWAEVGWAEYLGARYRGGRGDHPDKAEVEAHASNLPGARARLLAQQQAGLVGAGDGGPSVAGGDVAMPDAADEPSGSGGFPAVAVAGSDAGVWDERYAVDAGGDGDWESYNPAALGDPVAEEQRRYAQQVGLGSSSSGAFAVPAQPEAGGVSSRGQVSEWDRWDRVAERAEQERGDVPYTVPPAPQAFSPDYTSPEFQSPVQQERFPGAGSVGSGGQSGPSPTITTADGTRWDYDPGLHLYSLVDYQGVTWYYDTGSGDMWSAEAGTPSANRSNVVTTSGGDTQAVYQDSQAGYQDPNAGQSYYPPGGDSGTGYGSGNQYSTYTAAVGQVPLQGALAQIAAAGPANLAGFGVRLKDYARELDATVPVLLREVGAEVPAEWQVFLRAAEGLGSATRGQVTAAVVAYDDAYQQIVGLIPDTDFPTSTDMVTTVLQQAQGSPPATNVSVGLGSPFALRAGLGAADAQRIVRSLRAVAADRSQHVQDYLRRHASHSDHGAAANLWESFSQAAETRGISDLQSLVGLYGQVHEVLAGLDEAAGNPLPALGETLDLADYSAAYHALTIQLRTSSVDVPNLYVAASADPARAEALAREAAELLDRGGLRETLAQVPNSPVLLLSVARSGRRPAVEDVAELNLRLELFAQAGVLPVVVTRGEIDAPTAQVLDRYGAVAWHSTTKRLSGSEAGAGGLFSLDLNVTHNFQVRESGSPAVAGREGGVYQAISAGVFKAAAEGARPTEAVGRAAEEVLEVLYAENRGRQRELMDQRSSTVTSDAFLERVTGMAARVPNVPSVRLLRPDVVLRRLGAEYAGMADQIVEAEPAAKPKVLVDAAAKLTAGGVGTAVLADLIEAETANVPDGPDPRAQARAFMVDLLAVLDRMHDETFKFGFEEAEGFVAANRGRLDVRTKMQFVEVIGTYRAEGRTDAMRANSEKLAASVLKC
jgi:hypothetical protein